MSELSPRVRKALFGKLNVASVVGAGKLSGFYWMLAPENQPLPYGIFQRIAPNTIHAFGLTIAAEDDLYLIKTLSDAQSVKGNPLGSSPQGFNETMLAAIENAIGNTLTLTGGGQVMAVYRLRDMPEYIENAPDNQIYHNGFYLRVVAE